MGLATVVGNSHIAPFLVDHYRLTIIGNLNVYDIDESCLQGWFMHWKTDFNSVIKISNHPIGRAKEHFRAPIVMENKNATMLQIAINNSAHLNLVANPRHARHQAAYTPNNQFNFDSSFGRFIQFSNHYMILNIIEFDLDGCR